MDKTKYLTIPDDMARGLIETCNAWNVRSNTLKAMAAAGTDLTTPSGVDYIQSVEAAAVEYETRIYELVRYAAEHSDYDPLTDVLHFHHQRGAAWWTPADKPDAGEVAVAPDQVDGAVAPAGEGASEEEQSAEVKQPAAEG